MTEDKFHAYDFFINSWEAESGIRRKAKRLLEESKATETLSEDAFVFLFDESKDFQSRDFLFFRLSEGEDPPVYTFYVSFNHFTGGPGTLRKSYGRFSMLLEEEVKSYRGDVNSRLLEVARTQENRDGEAA
jgi:hypothetical protein